MGIVPWHQFGSSEGVAEFVDPLVKCPSGFSDVHQKVFPNRADAVKTRFFRDEAELFSGCSEGYPRGPG